MPDFQTNHVLYSKTRNVAYLNDQPHTRFWSYYIRSKYPNDKWQLMTDTEVAFIELCRGDKTMKLINIGDHLDRVSSALRKEIYDQLESSAINYIQGFTFIVAGSSRGEVSILYSGTDRTKAFTTYRANTRRTEGVEVWRNGIYVDLVTSEMELRSYAS